MSTSSSMVYFPVFEEPNEDENNVNNNHSANSTCDGIRIFNLFSTLFRSTNSTSRLDSSSSIPDKAFSTNDQNAFQRTTKSLADRNGSTENSTTSLADSQLGPITSVRKRLIDYKKSEFRRYWMPDSAGNECYECNEKFNTFRRRHHCRLCGQIFCKGCASRQMSGTDLGYNGVLRLCNFCAEQVDAHIALRRERRETVKSFAQIEDDEVFTGVPTEANGANQEANHRLQSVKQSNVGLEGQRNGSEKFTLTDGSTSSFPENQLLEPMFEQKMEQLLDFLLLREQLEPRWKDLLWSLSRTVTDRIAGLPLSSPEALNILDFLHIKKLHLAEDPASVQLPSGEIINGIAFSKSMAHSAMPLVMKNVSLMLLNGTIAYERVLEKFTSLEPMMAQERQYLRLQCDRVLSRRVSLLLTESSISPAAIDMLMAEGISVVANVKANVLLRIARATCADILSSLDAHFLQPRVGFVPDFCQREYIVADGKTKRLLLLENCVGNFGVTVLLKGASRRELIAAKRLLRFLVLSRYSTRLEMSFLSMFNSLPRENIPKRINSDFHCHICELNARHNCSNDDASQESEFLQAMSAVQLTNSPAINFATPYLETPAGRCCPLRSYTKGAPLFHYLRPADFTQRRNAFDALQADLERIKQEELVQRRRNGAMRHRCLSADAMAGEPRRLLDPNAWINFRASSALHFRRRAELNKASWEEKHQKQLDLLAESEANECFSSTASSGTQSDILSPYNHQGVAFLYCANARRATFRRIEEASRIFCTGPYVLQRQFYHGKDNSLGTFLLSCCFNTDFKCKGCERPMIEHLRRIVHGNSRIEVVTRDVSSSSIGSSSTRNASTSSLATAAAAAVGPFVSGGVAASIAAMPSATVVAPDDELNRSLPLDELPSSIPNNNCSSIICWLRCSACSANSSIVTMPDEVFHMSFAKFVDYLANGSHWVSPFPSSSIDLADCHHCTFHCHSRFFARGNFVTQFRVNPIYPLNVIFAPIPCTIENSTMDQQLKEPSLPIQLRDTVDAKGVPVPDVGSIIAHALSQSPKDCSNSAKGSSASLCSSTATTNGNKQQQQQGFAESVDITHADEQCQYSVKVYFPEQFERFRPLIFADGEQSFIQSLSRSSPWYPQGGKSGAVFSRTDDERFVLKTLNRFELDAFKQSALRYIDYISMAMMEKKLTALCKIFGAFTVNFTNKQTGQSLKSDLIVMEYLFYRRDIKQIWDLKGSLRNRLASTKSDNNGASSVLLDENYIQNLWRNQIYVSTHSKTALSQAIINDSHFLADQGIMDYSLLAGVCRGDQDEVIIGIVDYMRTYTFDKKVESAIKNAIPLTNSSTVISPEQYCRRFYEAIDGYFAVAPDQWTSDSVFT